MRKNGESTHRASDARTSSIVSGALNNPLTARFCRFTLRPSRSLTWLSADLPSRMSSRAYGAEISEISNRGERDLPMPSSTVKERTTNVNSAGKRNGLSADATSRSSPMDDRICTM